MRLRYSVLLPALLCGVALSQPQGQVLWTHHGTDGIYSTVAIEDTDQDSTPEVVGAIYYGGTPSDPRKVYCLSGRTGDSLWVSTTAYGTWGNKGLAGAPDLNGDGVDDVILGTVGTYIPPGRSCIAINGATGENLWVFGFGQERGWCYSVRPFLAPDGSPVDLDHDGFAEVLAGVGGTTNDSRGTAIAISGNTGDSIWAFRPDYDGCQSLAPFADINSDSVPDVLVGAGGNGTDNRAFCVSGSDGSLLWQFETNGSVSDIERIADVNGSGFDDVICGGWGYSVYCLEGLTGDSLWATGLGTGNTVMELLPIRDVNADGKADVVVGSWASQVHVLSGADGSILWSGTLANDVWSVDTLADVTGDGVPEVVGGCLGDGSGVVKVFSGADGSPLWYYNFTERVYDVTGMPDLNADGKSDVVVALQDQGHDPYHIYAFDGSVGTGLEAGPSTSVSAAVLTPVFGRRALRLSAPAGSRWLVRFSDAAGRDLGLRLSGVGDGGQHCAVVPELPGGVVFARLEVDGGTVATAKLISPPR
jgi:outer membrane protein assembly factor BamB